jgi:hypothetical protein
MSARFWVLKPMVMSDLLYNKLLFLTKEVFQPILGVQDTPFKLFKRNRMLDSAARLTPYKEKWHNTPTSTCHHFKTA